MTKNRITDLLRESHIPFEKWGTGMAKTIDHLVNEVRSGEATLEPNGNTLVRKLNVATVNVFHVTESATLKLYEEKQVFADARERRRELPSSLSERLGPAENPFHAARRAFWEELAIIEDIDVNLKGFNFVKEESSPSFPGLPTWYALWHFNARIPRHLYLPEGYIERQEDKSSYFVWRDITAELLKDGDHL